MALGVPTQMLEILVKRCFDQGQMLNDPTHPFPEGKWLAGCFLHITVTHPLLHATPPKLSREKQIWSGWWFQPLWKISVSWDDDIPNIWQNQNVPNHQPVMIFQQQDIFLADFSKSRGDFHRTGFCHLELQPKMYIMWATRYHKPTIWGWYI